MSSYVQTGSFTAKEKFTNEGLFERILKFVIIRNQPFTIVESKELRECFAYCNPNARLPSDTTVRNAIKRMFDNERDTIKKMLQEIPGKISFILDGWTSKNQFPFLGVMAEWIDSDWKYNSVLVDLVIMEGSHTGANIAGYFWEIIDSFGLKNKIQSVTTDNTGNMDTFFTSFEKIAKKNNFAFDKQNSRVRCLAHILNLCCQAALESVNSESSFGDCVDNAYDKDFDGMEDLRTDKGILSKLRKCVVKIRSSPQRREAFKRQCDAAQLKCLELTRDVGTRWNSTYDMIVRVLSLRSAIDCTTQTDKDLSRYSLSESEWNSFEILKDYLEPYKDITVFLSSEKFPTISSCAIIYGSVFEHLEKYKVDVSRHLQGLNPKTGKIFPDWIRSAAAKSCDKRTKYYPSADCIAYVIGTVLDPRCKLEIFPKSLKLCPKVVASYKKKILEIWKSNYKPPLSEDSSKTQTDESVFAQQLAKIRKTDANLDELDVYLKTKTVSSNFAKSGTLGWWKDHENDFPFLSKMARDYLAACGTGVPVERLFSLGPDLLKVKRMCMSADTIRECISLKCWLLFKENYNFSSDFMNAVVEKMNGD